MYRYNYYQYDSPSVSIFSGFLLVVWIIVLLIGIFGLICTWKVYEKAGKAGWTSIIPIYNVVVLLEITELPMWYIALLFVPIGNIIVLIFIYLELARRFGKSDAFGIGLVFLSTIFMAMLAFDKNAVYIGKSNDNQV